MRRGRLIFVGRPGTPSEDEVDQLRGYYPEGRGKQHPASS